MPMRRDCYPLQIALPDGRRAEYVPGTRPPRYTIDGQPTAIDVTIPDDLVATGWYWSGSFLYQPWPEPRTEAQGPGPGVAISTATYGLPGYTELERGSVWDVARNLDALRVQLAARPTKNVKAGKRTVVLPIVAVPEPEPVAEQMELAL